jgi:RNA polymerase sigma factor (sigma-70 family)
VQPAHNGPVDSCQAGLLKMALENLRERDRELIHRRYYLDESYREIAEALGMTVNHVGVSLFRAESRLKNILLKHRGEL